MNKLAVFVVAFVAMLLNKSVEGQLTCFQGARVTTAGVTTNTAVSTTCPISSHLCYRNSETTSVVGVTSKKFD